MQMFVDWQGRQHLFAFNGNVTETAREVSNATGVPSQDARAVINLLRGKTTGGYAEHPVRDVSGRGGGTIRAGWTGR